MPVSLDLPLIEDALPWSTHAIPGLEGAVAYLDAEHTLWLLDIKRDVHTPTHKHVSDFDTTPEYPYGVNYIESEGTDQGIWVRAGQVSGRAWNTRAPIRSGMAS